MVWGFGEKKFGRGFVEIREEEKENKEEKRRKEEGGLLRTRPTQVQPDSVMSESKSSCPSQLEFV